MTSPQLPLIRSLLVSAMAIGAIGSSGCDKKSDSAPTPANAAPSASPAPKKKPAPEVPPSDKPTVETIPDADLQAVFLDKPLQGTAHANFDSGRNELWLYFTDYTGTEKNKCGVPTVGEKWTGITVVIPKSFEIGKAYELPMQRKEKPFDDLQIRLENDKGGAQLDNDKTALAYRIDAMEKPVDGDHPGHLKIHLAVKGSGGGFGGATSWLTGSFDGPMCSQ